MEGLPMQDAMDCQCAAHEALCQHTACKALCQLGLSMSGSASNPDLDLQVYSLIEG
jgi:hypothetical protein